METIPSSLVIPTKSRKRKTPEPEYKPSEQRKCLLKIEKSFCDECLTLDLRKALDSLEFLSENPTRYIFLADVGRRYRRPLRDDCPLCEILAISRVDRHEFTPSDRNSHEDFDKLYAFSFLRMYKGTNYWDGEDSIWHAQNDSVLLAVVPSFYGSSGRDWKVLQHHAHQNGYIVCCPRSKSRPRALTARIVASHFNQSQVIDWLQYCKSHHSKLCSQTGSMMEELKLIDCENLDLIKAGCGAVYAALSYVWGPLRVREENDLDGTHGLRLPPVVPASILDAVEVAKSLGIRYLWVDKYCIDQDKEKKSEQIRHMDLIYQNAELTIIAAAGLDEDHGLPGMAHRTRAVQPKVTCEGFSIVSTMKDPQVSIQLSKWWTRGWTFQEAVLSTRRLVFTEEQVYFECNSMNCHESLTGSLDVLHTKDRSTFRPFLRAGLFGRNERNDDPVRGSFVDEKLGADDMFFLLLTAIEQYSARELRYDSDSLNAFAGVLRKFEKSEKRLCQRYGIPYLLPGRDEKTSDYSRTANYRILGVSWYTIPGLSWFHVRPCWSVLNAPRRRPDLPSWTWAGWVGEVTYPEHRLTVKEQEHNWKRAPFVYTGKNKPKFEAMYAQKENTECLWLRAYPMQPSAFSFDSVSEKCNFLGDYPTELQMSAGPDTPAQFFEEWRAEKRWVCIYLGHFRGLHKSCRLAMVLEVREKDIHYIEPFVSASRAGMMIIRSAREEPKTLSNSLDEGVMDHALGRYKTDFQIF